MDFVSLIAKASVLTQSASQPSTGEMLISFLPFVAIIIIFYFFMLRPQQKKDKQDAQMRKNLQIGDEVVTNAGIVGIVAQIHEDTETVVIETTANHTRIRVKKWAIIQNETVHDDTAETGKKKV